MRHSSNQNPQQGGYAAMNQMLNNAQQRNYQQQQQQYSNYQNQNPYQQQNQQQQYNNNVYQMQRNQMVRQQPQQQQQQNQNIVQSHLMQLQGQYKYQIDAQSSTHSEQVIFCDLKIGNNQEAPIKIVISTTNFPSQKPKIYVRIQLKQKYIDSNNWEIAYMPFYQWNQNSKLIELLKAIEQKFIEHPPAQDPLLNEINGIKLRLNEDEMARNMNSQLGVQKVFPNANSQDAFQAIQSKQSYKDDIQKTDLYKKFAQFNLELAQKVQQYAEMVESKEINIEEKKQLLEGLSQSYEEMQNQHLKLHNDCKFIKDRFNSAAILQILDQEIARLSDQTLQDEEQIVQTLDFNNCDSFVKEYFENKKRLHALEIKKDKYNEIL